MSSSSVSSMPPACSFFAQGKCRNGSSCKFFHAAREDLAKSPLPCKFFLQGACKAGRDCKFSHVVDGSLQRVSSSTRETTVAPGAFGKQCKFFDYGGCAAGDRCPYLHEVKSEGADNNSKKKSSAKAYVINPNTKNAPATASPAAPSSDDKEEKAAAWTGAQPESLDQQQVTELSDFISKEEELYYYGAPGDFEDAEAETFNKPSYADIAALNIEDELDAAVPAFVERPAAPKTCTFFLQGLCRYGDSCFYTHALPESFETQEDVDAMNEELRLSQDLECNICYDNILQKQERFGLLSGCTHAFCLSCVRNWRGTADQPKQTVRQCPVCRVETHFIIPSSRMVTDPARKKALTDTYRKNLASIPCHHFNEGSGTCPFGTSCFYAHRYPDGTVEDRRVRTAVDSDGHYDVLRQVRLEHFLQQDK